MTKEPTVTVERRENEYHVCIDGYRHYYLTPEEAVTGGNYLRSYLQTYMDPWLLFQVIDLYKAQYDELAAEVVAEAAPKKGKEKSNDDSPAT